MKQLIRFVIAELGLTRDIKKSRKIIKSKFYKIYPDEEIKVKEIIINYNGPDKNIWPPKIDMTYKKLKKNKRN